MTFLKKIATAALLIALSAAFRPQAHAQGGVPLWTNRYDGPIQRLDASYAVAVNRDGIVFVTGYSQRTPGDNDYATIAYSNDGLPLWTNRYNGTGSFEDEPGSLATDTNGDVIVTGASEGIFLHFCYATIKYSSAGVPLWTNRYSAVTNGEAIAHSVGVDASGSVFVTGYAWTGSNYDYATLAYSSAGVPLWTNLYDGPANDDDEGRALAVDKDGNVYVTGFSTGAGTGHDYTTIAYSNSGAPLWTNRYNGPANGTDEARAIAVSGSGNVYVTGLSDGGSSSRDFATIAYSSAGVALWTNRYSGPGNGNDFANGIAVDSHENIFVTGSSGQGTATLSYSSAGVPLWTNVYKSGNNGSSVALDSEGNVFVTGYDPSPGVGGFLTLAYSNAGASIWTNHTSGIASAAAVDGSGNVFVTGQGGNDYLTVKYSSSLTPLPHLDFQRENDQMVLSWTNSLFTLQTAPSLTETFTSIPDAISPYTNAMTGPQQFFRLKGP